MDKDGVTGTPVISYLNVLFDDTSMIPQHDRLMVTHHVKDFDTWKKAFDAEGDDARATNGLVKGHWRAILSTPTQLHCFLPLQIWPRPKQGLDRLN